VSEKTEDPTPRRLRKARGEGDSGVSSYAAQAIAFVAAVAIVPSAVRALASHASASLRVAIASAAHAPASGVALAFDSPAFATSVLSLVIPALAVVGLAGGVAHVVQTGGTVAAARLAPKLDRLNPATGAKALVSGARLFAVGRALVAACLVGWLAYRDLTDRVVDIARVAGRASWTGVVVADVAGRFAWHAAAVGLALGLADFFVTRRTWLGRLRMTKDEVKREHKESEGDPMVRAARHRAYQELLAQVAIANVRTATVVVVNPTHLACALRYDEKGGDEAPVVVASGEGDLAARIAQAAQEWGVPIVRDVPLARALVELGVGDAIPEALYEVVAEILRELWQAEP
jgi:flagellar biosynthesis protein FlhB